MGDQDAVWGFRTGAWDEERWRKCVMGSCRHGCPMWQPSFHDRIVRNDAEMDRVRTYIANNPALWVKDVFCEE
jgi:hypothetical protein